VGSIWTSTILTRFSAKLAGSIRADPKCGLTAKVEGTVTDISVIRSLVSGDFYQLLACENQLSTIFKVIGVKIVISTEVTGWEREWWQGSVPPSGLHFASPTLPSALFYIRDRWRGRREEGEV